MEHAGPRQSQPVVAPDEAACGRDAPQAYYDRAHARRAAYSPSVSSDALPPAAVVLIVSVRSVTKRAR